MNKPCCALILMGVMGSGKSTIAEKLAARLGWEFRDAGRVFNMIRNLQDDFHSDENKSKMRNGVALTDEDRQPWLESISNYISKHLMAETPVIISCSALKNKYRELLRTKDEHIRSKIYFIHLKGSKELIKSRLENRKGHFMNINLLDSQFATLEDPQGENNVIEIDIGTEPDAIVDDIVNNLTQKSII